jgi:hypothetical protein
MAARLADTAVVLSNVQRASAQQIAGLGGPAEAAEAETAAAQQVAADLRAATEEGRNSREAAEAVAAGAQAEAGEATAAVAVLEERLRAAEVSVTAMVLTFAWEGAALLPFIILIPAWFPVFLSRPQSGTWCRCIAECKEPRPLPL